MAQSVSMPGTLPPNHPAIAATLPPEDTETVARTSTLPPRSMGAAVPGTLPPQSMNPGSMNYAPRSAPGAPPMPPPAEAPSPASTMGPSDMYPAVASTPLVRKEPKDEDFKKWHNVRHFIAYMFTLTAFTILAAPTMICIQLGSDIDAGYWIGKWGLVAFLVPVFLVGQHLYHLWMLAQPNRRRRYIFLVVPVVPAVFFMIIGGTYMSFARSLYGRLKSEDCSQDGPTPGKFWMQEAYDEAHDAYMMCLKRLQMENYGLPLRRTPNLQSCQEWEKLLEGGEGVVPWKGYKVSRGTLRQHNPSNDHRWQYLADVEANHLCGGFCTKGRSLFVSYDAMGHTGGACSQFVAFRFLSIAHWGLVVFVVGCIILLLSIPTYLFSRSFLTSMGYKSAVTMG